MYVTLDMPIPKSKNTIKALLNITVHPATNLCLKLLNLGSQGSAGAVSQSS